MAVALPSNRVRAPDLGGGVGRVADTNNHAIRIVDLGSYEVRALTLSGLGTPMGKRCGGS